VLAPTPSLTRESSASSLFGLLLQFSYLQVLDFLTTIAFLLHGVQEGNPFVRWCLMLGHNPLAGLFAVKALALGLGAYCWWMRKARLLQRINILFAALITWNLVALIMASVHH
jgi:hypothetical protein